MNDALWSFERQFWLGGVEVYERDLSADALMVFAPPAGVLDRAATILSVARAPRWREVHFTDTQIIMPKADVAILVYAATALRTDQLKYRATCSSTYVRTDRWQIALHHQTPLTAVTDSSEP